MKIFAWIVPGLALSAMFAFYYGGTDVAALRAPRGSVTYTDRNGGILGTVLGAGSSHVARVPLAGVSPVFLQAIVTAEDARFWRHGAVDVPALLRAARDFAIFGQARSGGSTIAMQLARLIDPSPSTIRGKLAQIVDAERIAMVSSRTAILQGYKASTAFRWAATRLRGRGGRANLFRRIGRRSRSRAGRAAGRDSERSGAACSGRRLARRCQVRQHFILARMAALGEITPAAAATAFAETLHVRRHESGIAGAPHALFFLSQSAGRPGRVRTTIDANLQRFVAAQTEDVVGALQTYHVTDGAALVVDNRTGEVLAYVGSPDYFSAGLLGSNDGVQALRQPGSSLKPFTYELALERGAIEPATILSDAPTAYALARRRASISPSITVAASAARRACATLSPTRSTHRRCKSSRRWASSRCSIDCTISASRISIAPHRIDGLGLTLGSGEVSLWELVGAYATMARGGDALPLTLVTGDAPAPPRPVGSRTYWQLVTDMLADPHARARNRSASAPCCRCRFPLR